MLNECQMHPALITQCLQPIREVRKETVYDLKALRQREDTISCLFLVISRDMPVRESE